MQGTQHLNLNSGLFYARSNKRTVALMGRIADHLESHQGEWDQAIFNHQLFFLSHGEYVNPGCSVRVMELHHFMNSKVRVSLFETDVQNNEATFKSRISALSTRYSLTTITNFKPSLACF